MKLGNAMLVLLALFGRAPAFAAESISPDEIDALASRAMDSFNITGMALTVVTGDEVLFTKAYGRREAGGDLQVDADTLFPFGSTGKAMTAATLAMMVDEGKLRWEDPVKEYIPEFEMSASYITEEFSVRDALTHRSGLPLGAGDLLFVPDGEPTIEDVLSALKNIPPGTSFRSEFAYDNLMYIVAGEVASRIEGKPWSVVVQERLFDPLGMMSCEPLPSFAAQAGNTVTQHSRPAGSMAAKPINPDYLLPDTASSAGGVSCSISDLSKWVQFWLRGARTLSGEKLISDPQLRQIWKGVTPFPVSPTMAEGARTHFALYGLGWGLFDFNGELLAAHKGGTLGAISHIALLPERDIGVFVVTNDVFPFVEALSYQILSEQLRIQNGRNWLSWAEETYSRLLASTKSDFAEASPSAIESERPLSAYLGVYEDPWYGDATIEERNGALYLDMRRSKALDAPLICVGKDKFLARWPDRTLHADAFVNFVTKNGRVVGITMEAVSDTTDFSFDFHHLRFKKIK